MITRNDLLMVLMTVVLVSGRAVAQDAAEPVAAIAAAPVAQSAVVAPSETEALAPEAAPAPALPSLAVTDFASDEPNDMTHGMPELISEALVNSGLFDVFERERLATLIQEQNLQTSGMVDANTAISLGKLSGVKYIVTGKIMNFGRELKTFNGFGANTQTAFYRLKAELKLIDTQTGKVLFAKTADAEEKEFSATAYDSMNTTMASKLAEKVSGKLVNALLANDLFKKAAPAGSDKVAVKINSNPTGADVEIDGVFFGNAGGEFSIAAGMHEIKVSLPGYEEWSKKVQVQAGTAFQANLVKKADVRVEVEQKTAVEPAPAPAPVTP
jgi:curli biogenesis system outer membrane secretion channel CsgG